MEDLTPPCFACEFPDVILLNAESALFLARHRFVTSTNAMFTGHFAFRPVMVNRHLSSYRSPYFNAIASLPTCARGYKSSQKVFVFPRLILMLFYPPSPTWPIIKLLKSLSRRGWQMLILLLKCSPLFIIEMKETSPNVTVSLHPPWMLVVSASCSHSFKAWKFETVALLHI